ncbi:MAG: YicC/YloC family endoribonuclease [Verrucomicrobiia bacterium]
MKSMTGYGCAEAIFGCRKILIEVFSVNRRQTEVQVVLPDEFSLLEYKIREYVSEFIFRGQVVVRVSINWVKGKVEPGAINHILAMAYAYKFRALAKKLGIAQDINLDLILRAPGVMEFKKMIYDQNVAWRKIKKVLDKALKDFLNMRAIEGSHLEEDLRKRIKIMEQILREVKERAPRVVEKYRENLKERIQNAGIPVSKEDEERLLKEIVIFADKSDISEEITRLESHFKKFYEYIRVSAKKGEPIGRTLDFLAQEMNREINTIGSKANDSFISHQVVVLKTELEKFREQVQNVE